MTRLKNLYFGGLAVSAIYKGLGHQTLSTVYEKICQNWFHENCKRLTSYRCNNSNPEETVQ